VSAAPARGEVVLDSASRAFELRPDRRRTLKELLVRRGGEGGSSVRALDAVDLRIAPGEAVGMVGRNGAGKTSTLRCLTGIVPLDSGRAECGGRTVSLLELGAGFHPDFSGRENIFLNGALHGFGRAEMEDRLDAIVEFSELGEFVDAPVRAYSSGMQLRLGFSIVAHLDADVMLIDEVLAVGDESFQRKCMARISERMEAGATLVLVSHDPTAIERICQRVVVLDGGAVAFDGPVADGLLFYHRLLGTERGRSQSLRPAGAGGASGSVGGGPQHGGSLDGRRIEISELELRDAGGALRSAYRSGEPLLVELTLRCDVPAQRAVVALEVRDESGERCFRTDTTLGAVDGRVEVGFEVPRLALLGGDYDVAVGALDQDAPAGVMLDRVARFSIAPTGDGEGTADLRGEWTVRASEAARR
jgi:ABC-type polysaccharide/polyol phosphate transport system ATPase subunit